MTTQVTGVLPVANGGTNVSSASDDQLLVSNGTTWQAKSLSNCLDSGGQHLNYTASSNSFSCGTSGDGTGGGSGNATWSTTTSQVVGEYINHPNNNTDIVCVGGTSTSTCSSYNDPNVPGSSVIVGDATSTPWAMMTVGNTLSVGGYTASGYFISTSTTANQFRYSSTTASTITSLYITGASTGCATFTGTLISSTGVACGSGSGGAAADFVQGTNYLSVNSLSASTTIPLYIKGTATSSFAGGLFSSNFFHKFSNRFIFSIHS